MYAICAIRLLHVCQDMIDMGTCHRHGHMIDMGRGQTSAHDTPSLHTAHEGDGRHRMMDIE